MHTLKEEKKKNETLSYDMMHPTFSLKASQLPEIKDWSVGKKYKMEIEVEMIGSNKDEYSEKQELSGRFKITKIGVEKEEDNAKKGYT